VQVVMKVISPKPEKKFAQICLVIFEINAKITHFKFSKKWRHRAKAILLE